jgi:large subunit ribosomal protein L25
VLSQVQREVNVEALPMEVPDRLELDISSMTIGDSLRISDIVVPDSVKLLDDPDSVVVTVTPPTKVEEPEEAEEAVEGEEGVEGEGEAAPEADAAEGESGGDEPAEG